MTEKTLKIDEAGIAEFREYLESNPKDAYFYSLYNRTAMLFDATDFSRQAIAFEMIFSTIKSFGAKLSHEDARIGYPVKAWREETVEVPVAWLKVLAESWEKYRNADAGTTLGEAFEIEGGGQGKTPVRAKLKNLKKDLRLSNATVVEYFFSSTNGKRSWEKAYSVVASQFDVSEDTVRRACKKYRKVTLDNLRDIGVISE